MGSQPSYSGPATETLYVASPSTAGQFRRWIDIIYYEYWRQVDSLLTTHVTAAKLQHSNLLKQGCTQHDLIKAWTLFRKLEKKHFCKVKKRILALDHIIRKSDVGSDVLWEGARNLLEFKSSVPPLYLKGPLVIDSWREPEQLNHAFLILNLASEEFDLANFIIDCDWLQVNSKLSYDRTTGWMLSDAVEA